MPTPYTLKKLTDIEDAAPGFGMEGVQEARFAKDALDTEDTGFSYHRLMPGKRQPFGHKHEHAEEVYVVLAGSGRVKLDEEILELGELDAIRVAPRIARCFEAGAEGMQLLAFGPRRDGDGELLMGWWAD